MKTVNIMEIFNLFRNLSLTEAGHSSLLKKLLNVNGKHNQTELFIKSFVENVLKCEYSQKLNVECEVKAGERGFIDIMIYTVDKQIIYIIENKINGANDRPNQLYRYWRNHIKTAEEKGIKGDFKIFYLTSNGGKPNSDSLSKPVVSKKTTKYDGLPDTLPMEVICISYKKDIRNWLNDCLSHINKTDENLRLTVTLEQYKEWIETN